MKVQGNTALLSHCGLTGTSLHVSLSGLGGNECFISVHSVDDVEVGLSLATPVSDCDHLGVWIVSDWIVKKRQLPNSCILVHAYDASKGRSREVRTVWSLFRLPRPCWAYPPYLPLERESKWECGTKHKRGGACFTLISPLIMVQYSNQSLYSMLALLHG